MSEPRLLLSTCHVAAACGELALTVGVMHAPATASYLSRHRAALYGWCPAIACQPPHSHYPMRCLKIGAWRHTKQMQRSRPCRLNGRRYLAIHQQASSASRTGVQPPCYGGRHATAAV